MNRILRNLCCGAAAISMCVQFGAIQANAIASEFVTPAACSQESDGIAPHADVIVTKFRINKQGVQQYRRWNETRGYWVDPDWIDVPG